jgi:hypothetical protein
VTDNRYLIANLIQCRPDTPRYVPAADVDIFQIQERVIEDILRSAQEQPAIEAAPKQIDPIQQTIITALRGHLGGAGTTLPSVTIARLVCSSTSPWPTPTAPIPSYSIRLPVSNSWSLMTGCAIP